MKEDSEINKYCSYLEEVKSRLSIIQKFTQAGVTLKEMGREDSDIEFVAIQLRKALESIAFASLIANKEIYSKTHKNFAKNWNPKLLMKDLERLNPDFYPKPIGIISEGKKVKSLDYLEEGFLTKDDFIFLYDKCGKALHTPNPYSNKSTTINLKISVNEWVNKIVALLYIHQIKLIDNNVTFVVYFQHPKTNKVEALKAVAVDDSRFHE